MQNDDQGLAPFPVGFQRFHRQKFLNYQFNRAHALGYADTDELRRTAASIKSQIECVGAFEALSVQAARAGRLKNATSYLRVSEFFTPMRSEEKVARYRRYRDLFDLAFASSGAVRHDVAYAGTS
jgi:hypothetical protein